MLLAAGVAPFDVAIAIPHGDVCTGGDVDVEVRGLATGDVQVRLVEVALAAQVEYRHREGGLGGASFHTRVRRLDVHAVTALPGPWPVAAGESVVLPARLAVPAGAPGTARSPLVTITWLVRVRVQVAGYLDVECRRTLVVRSPATEHLAVADSDPVAVDRRCVGLSFEALSTRHVSGGRTVSGTLVATPRRMVGVRSIGVAVALRQDVHHGEWIGEDPSRNPAYQDASRDTEVCRVPLSGRLVLEPGLVTRLPFALLMPEELPAPTISTTNFALRWILRGWVERPLRPSPYVELELHGRTTGD